MFIFSRFIAFLIWEDDMKRFVMIVFIQIILIFITTGCSDDDNPVGAAGGNHVAGQVMVYRCSLGEYDFNNLGWDHRYTVATGEKAEIRFVCADGHSRQTITDDSSAFLLSLDSGVYDIIVATPHSYPDTFYNIEITGDTSLNLKILFDYLETDYLTFYYRYDSGLDSLGERLERHYLGKLNQFTGNELRLDLAKRSTTMSYMSDIYYVRYRIPTTKFQYLWETYEKARWYLDMESEEFPEALKLEYLGYFCLF